MRGWAYWLAIVAVALAAIIAVACAEEEEGAGQPQAAPPVAEQAQPQAAAPSEGPALEEGMPNVPALPFASVADRSGPELRTMCARFEGATCAEETQYLLTSVSYRWPEGYRPRQIYDFYRDELAPLGWEFRWEGPESRPCTPFEVRYVLQDTYAGDVPCRNSRCVERELGVVVGVALCSHMEPGGVTDNIGAIDVTADEDVLGVYYSEWLASSEEVAEATNTLRSIAANPSYSQSEKEEQFRVVQRNLGEEVVAQAIRLLPIWEPEQGMFKPAAAWVDEFAAQSGLAGSSPIERDPIGAGVKLFFDPSPDTIRDMMGIPSP